MNLNSVDLISESLKVIFNHQLKELVFQDNNEAAIKNKLSKQYGKTIETIKVDNEDKEDVRLITIIFDSNVTEEIKIYSNDQAYIENIEQTFVPPIQKSRNEQFLEIMKQAEQKMEEKLF